jgi:MATE family multidrug resistance protein
VAIIFVLLYFIIGHYAITLFTDQPIVVSTANVYFGWVLLIPIAGMAAFVWDGIYVGCGYVGNMLICTAIGAVMFFATWFVLKSYINNHALWLAFILYLATRGLVLQIASKKNFPTTQNNT